MHTTRYARSSTVLSTVARALLVALVLLVGACAAPDAGEDAAASGTAVSSASGEELYQANCAQCHGADLRGTSQGPPHLDPVYLPDHHSDDAFLLAVRNGVRPHHWQFGPMPPIPGLSTEQVEAITAYVRDQQRAAGMLD